LEARAIRRERIGTQHPWVLEGAWRTLGLIIVRGGRRQIMVAVIEYDLEHPLGIFDLGIDLRLVEKPRALARLVEQRRAIAVINVFQVAVRGTTRIIRCPAVALMGLVEADTLAVFRLVAVQHPIALVISGFAD